MKNLLSFILEILLEISFFFTFRRFSTSIFLLIIANSAPIFGILFLEWNSSIFIFIYWAESIIIGLYNVIKMFSISIWSALAKKGKFLMGIFLTGFFCIHYFLFNLIHLLFLPNIKVHYFENEIKFTLALLIASHGFSLFRYFFYEKEYQTREATTQMISPYGRIVTLHLTILFAGFAGVHENNASIGAVVLLMCFKSFFDLLTHYIAHRKVLKKQK